MPAQCCVGRYQGKRVTSWWIKWVDGSGNQIRKVLGRESDGWTKELAEEELQERLGRAEVDRNAQRVGLLRNELRGRERFLGLVGKNDLARAYSNVRRMAQEIDQITSSRETRPHLRAALAAVHAAEDALILAAREERGSR